MRGRSTNAKRAQYQKRRTRVVGHISGSDRPRLTVYRSTKHMYAQIVDPTTMRTIASASTLVAAVRGSEPAQGKLEAARRVGRAIAELARKHRIQEVVFNRNGFLYHGRVKALAEAAREAGLRF